MEEAARFPFGVSRPHHVQLALAGDRRRQMADSASRIARSLHLPPGRVPLRRADAVGHDLSFGPDRLRVALAVGADVRQPAVGVSFESSHGFSDQPLGYRSACRMQNNLAAILLPDEVANALRCDRQAGVDRMALAVGRNILGQGPGALTVQRAEDLEPIRGGRPALPGRVDLAAGIDRDGRMAAAAVGDGAAGPAGLYAPAVVDRGIAGCSVGPGRMQRAVLPDGQRRGERHAAGARHDLGQRPLDAIQVVW